MVFSADAFAQVGKTVGWSGKDAGPGGYFSPDAACAANYAYDASKNLLGGGGAVGGASATYPSECTATACNCSYRAANNYTYKTTTGTGQVLACPASYSFFNVFDNLCYPAPPARCMDGSFRVSASMCPLPPACAVGYVDGGIDGKGARVCTLRQCPAPSVLKVDGTCGAPDPNPSAPITPSNKGETGATGAQGVKGDKGDKGDQGVAGQTGADGAKGDKGDKGETGATGVGVAGATGATGAKGDRGADGINGTNGRDGAVGATGAVGAAGANGATGATGAKGETGAQGAQGIQGIQGVTGARGIDGSVGLTGAMGLQGIQGETGETGLSFCEANPGLAVCKDSTVAGSCGEISCSGDAIQCATLRAAAAMECAQRKDKEELAGMDSTGLGKAIAAGQDPLSGEIAARLKGDEIDLGANSLDTAGFLGASGTCIAPKQFTFSGRAVNVDFASICEKILPLRAVMLMLGALVSYMIVSKSILQG